MMILTPHNIATAFISCAPRSVGGSARILDAHNPTLLAQGASPNVRLVAQREAMSVGLAWTFGLFTSALTQKLTQKLRLSKNMATLGVALLSNILAEVVARAVAYRGVRRAVSQQAASAESPLATLLPLPRVPFSLTPPPLFQRVAFSATSAPLERLSHG